jgi:transposase
MRLQLTPPQRVSLERQLRLTRDAGTFRRTLAVLEAARGRPVAEIALLVRTSRVSVHRWLDCYTHSHDPACLLDHRGGNHPTVWTEDLQAVLRDCLGRRPEHFGYRATGWTARLLRDHLARRGGQCVSPTAIRRQLSAWDYVWKRPRYVLTPDPERGKKTADPLAPGGLAAAHRQAVRG